MSIYLVTPIYCDHGIDRRGDPIECASYADAVNLATQKIAEERVWRGYEIVKRPHVTRSITRSPPIEDFTKLQESLDGKLD
jgi:hypothetical protein